MDPAIELVADRQNLCGEAPLWDFREQRLFWVDQDNPGLFNYTPATGLVETLDRKMQITGIALNKNGGLVAGGRTGLFTWDTGGKVRVLRESYEGVPLVFNDLIAGPGGRIYGGTVDWNESGLVKPGTLYRFDPDGTVAVEDEGIILSNGLAFSPDNGTLYFSDTGCKSIFSYDVHPVTGALSNRRAFAAFSEDDGIPDGITTDGAGFLWAALWYGGEVVRLDPDGVIERRIRVPAKQTSSVMFGGEDLCDLYITSAGEYWPSNLQPRHFDTGAHMGGALYRVRLDIPGRREQQADF
jgi:sugar lactone lactonase YvrE